MRDSSEGEHSRSRRDEVPRPKNGKKNRQESVEAEDLNTSRTRSATGRQQINQPAEQGVPNAGSRTRNTRMRELGGTLTHAEAVHTTPSTRRPRSARAGVTGREFSGSVVATPNEADGHTTGASEPVPTRVHRRPRSGEGRAGPRSGTGGRGGRHETRGPEAPPVAVIDEPVVTGYGNQKWDPQSDEGHTREDETGDDQISNDGQPSIERQMSPVSSLRGGADMLRSAPGGGALNLASNADAPDRAEVERNPVGRRAGPTRSSGTANASRASSRKATTEAPREVTGSGSHKNGLTYRTRQSSRRVGKDEPREGLHSGKSEEAKAPSEVDLEQHSVNGRAEATRRRSEHKTTTHNPTRRASGHAALERYAPPSEMEPEVIDLDGSDNEAAAHHETADTREESGTESESSAETTTGSPDPETEADDDLSSGPENSRNPARSNYLGVEIVDVDEMTGSEGEALTKAPPTPQKAARPSRGSGEVAPGVAERASPQGEAGSKAASTRPEPNETGSGGGDEIAPERVVAPRTESQARTEAVSTRPRLDQPGTVAGEKVAAGEGAASPVATLVLSAPETADEGAAHSDNPVPNTTQRDQALPKTAQVRAEAPKQTAPQSSVTSAAQSTSVNNGRGELVPGSGEPAPSSHDTDAPGTLSKYQPAAGVQRPLKRTARSFENAALMSLRNKVLMSVKKHKDVGQNKGEHAKSGTTSAIPAGDEEAPGAHQLLKDRRAEDTQVLEQEVAEGTPEPTNLPDKGAGMGRSEADSGADRPFADRPVELATDPEAEEAKGIQEARGLPKRNDAARFPQASVDSSGDEFHDGAGSSASRVEIGRKRPPADGVELQDRLAAPRASGSPRQKKPNLGGTAGTAANADTPKSASDGEIEEPTARKDGQGATNYVTDSREDDKFETEPERGKLAQAEAPEGLAPTDARLVATQTPMRKVAETQVQTTTLPTHASGGTGGIWESHGLIQIGRSTVTADKHVRVPTIEKSERAVQAELSEPERTGDSPHDLDKTRPVPTQAEVLRLIQTCRRAPLFWGQSLRELRDKVEQGERHLAAVKDEVARWEKSAEEETRRISVALESLQRLLDPPSEPAGTTRSEQRHAGAPLVTSARAGTIDSAAGDSTAAGPAPGIAPVLAGPLFKSSASLPDNCSAEEVAMEVDNGLSGPTIGVDDTNNRGNDSVGAKLSTLDRTGDPAVPVQSAKPAGQVELDRSAPRAGTMHETLKVFAQEQGCASREPNKGSPPPATTADIATSDDRPRTKRRGGEGEAVSLARAGLIGLGTPPARETEELVSDSDEEFNKRIPESGASHIQRRKAEKALEHGGEATAGTSSGSVRPHAVEQSAGYVHGPEAAASVADATTPRDFGEKSRAESQAARPGPPVPDAVDGLALPMSLEVPTQSSEVRTEPGDQQAKDGVAAEEGRSRMAGKEQQAKEQPSTKANRAHPPRLPPLEHDLSSEAELQPDAGHTATFGGETDGDEDSPAIEITDAERMHGKPFHDVMDEPRRDAGEGTGTSRRLIASDADPEDAPADRVIGALRRDEAGLVTAEADAPACADLQVGAVRSDATDPAADLPSAAAWARPPAPEIDRVNSNAGIDAGKHQPIEGGPSAALPPLPLEAPQSRAAAPEDARQSPQETAVLSVDLAATDTPSTSVINGVRTESAYVDVSSAPTVAEPGPGTVAASEPALPKTAQTGLVEPIEPVEPPEAGQDAPTQPDVTTVEEVAPTNQAALRPDTGAPQSSPSANVRGPACTSDSAETAAPPAHGDLGARATALQAGTGTDAATAGPRVLQSAPMALSCAKDGRAPAAAAERVRPEETKGLNSSLTSTGSTSGAPPAPRGGASTGPHHERSSGARSASDGLRRPGGPIEPTEPSLVRLTGPASVRTPARAPQTHAKAVPGAGGGRVSSTLLSSSRAYRLKAFATNLAEVVELRDNFVDPTKTFCYWDLRGTCNNKTCQYQHFRDLKISPLNLLEEVLCYCPEASYDFESKKLRGWLEAGLDSAVVLQQALKLCGFEKDELPTRLRKRPKKPIHAASDYQGAPQAHARNVG